MPTAGLRAGSVSGGAIQLNSVDVVNFDSGGLTVTTQAPGDNTTRPASTAFVTAAVAASAGVLPYQRAVIIQTGYIFNGAM